MAPLPPGPEFNTFTAIGRCEKTGRLGVATSTRSLAVGARVPFVGPRTGAVAIMAIADARLGKASAFQDLGAFADDPPFLLRRRVYQLRQSAAVVASIDHLRGGDGAMGRG